MNLASLRAREYPVSKDRKILPRSEWATIKIELFFAELVPEQSTSKTKTGNRRIGESTQRWSVTMTCEMSAALPGASYVAFTPAALSGRSSWKNTGEI